jgi:hypothetical protein
MDKTTKQLARELEQAFNACADFLRDHAADEREDWAASQQEARGLVRTWNRASAALAQAPTLTDADRAQADDASGRG